MWLHPNAGQVVAVRLIGGKNFAFVSYGTEFEAGTAILQLNQSFLEGNTLSVTHVSDVRGRWPSSFAQR